MRRMTLATASATLEQAIAAWFARAPVDFTTAPAGRSQMLLRQQIGAHVVAGRALAGKSGQRQQWLSARHALADANGRRITHAGGTGLSFDSTQVLARKSLVELSQAAAALDAVADLNEGASRAEQAFASALDRQ